MNKEIQVKEGCGRAWSARRAMTHSSVEEKKIEPQMDVKDADEEEE